MACQLRSCERLQVLLLAWMSDMPNPPAAQMQATKVKRNTMRAIVAIELRAEHNKAGSVQHSWQLLLLCCSSCALLNIFAMLQTRKCSPGSAKDKFKLVQV